MFFSSPQSQVAQDIKIYPIGALAEKLRQWMWGWTCRSVAKLYSHYSVHSLKRWSTYSEVLEWFTGTSQDRVSTRRAKGVRGKDYAMPNFRKSEPISL